MTFGRRFGPGFLVTAAFIGPGTVTTASLAGVHFGYALVWTVVFATAATILLQEMAARLGVVARMGLGEALRRTMLHPALRKALAVLVVLAIGTGNAAYQAGNLTGAAIGLSIFGGDSRFWLLAVIVMAVLLLASRFYHRIERAFIALVAFMTVAFLVTAVLVRHDTTALFNALISPSIPDGAFVTALALIGTTVVPYNFFLHSSAAHAKWPVEDADTSLAMARHDTVLAVSLGGVVTLAILLSAVPLHLAGSIVKEVGDIAVQLEPLLGPAAKYCFGAGLFAAGLTSAVTAPLAAAYAVCGVLGWPVDLTARRFRLVWGVVFAVGAMLAVVGTRPIEVIVLAQATNGLLLPLLAAFLLFAVNRHDLMGKWCNGPFANVAGVAVVLFTCVLGGIQLWRLLAG